MRNGWIDAHTHLNDQMFIQDFEQVMKRIRENKIRHINLVGIDIQSTQRAFELADTDDLFDISVGLHPADLKKYTQSDANQLLEWTADPRVVSVGEIGLDYHWHKDNIEIQQQVFIEQIKLANDLRKPVMIHSRNAMRDTIDILRNYRPMFGCIMHCFSGSVSEALECIDLGFMISMAGPVTFKNGHEAREVLKVIPLNQLLIETDAPYLAPHPYRGKRNESSYVKIIGEKVAEVKEVPIDILQSLLIENYRKTFGK